MERAAEANMNCLKSFLMRCALCELSKITKFYTDTHTSQDFEQHLIASSTSLHQPVRKVS